MDLLRPLNRPQADQRQHRDGNRQDAQSHGSPQQCIDGIRLLGVSGVPAS